MALSPAEKQKNYRERKKEAEKTAEDVVSNFLKEPFYEWLSRHDGNFTEDVCYPLEWAGFEPPDFSNDDDPRFAEIFGPDEPDGGTIGRAERMVSYLLDASRGLARLVNEYKVDEINARLGELENALKGEMTDKVRKQTLADFVRLTRLRDRLGKVVRHEFPVTSVKGE